MPTTLYQLLQANFGVNTSRNVNPLVAQVQTTLTKVVSHNPNRVGLLIVNSGANSIYLSPLNTVAVGAGIVLVPNGGGISFVWDEDFEFTTSEFFAFASGGASNILLIEVVVI